MMTERVTIVYLAQGRQCVAAGEPMFDPEAGILSVLFKDGTARHFNWDHVVDYYHASEDESRSFFRSREGAK